MSVLAALLVAPGRSGTGQRSRKLVERNLLIYRRTPVILLTGLVEPFLYLISIGAGVGRLVGSVGGVPYAQYIAPALLASAAMNGAIFDSTYNIYFKLKISRTYDAILSTPLGVRDVTVGEITSALLRGTVYAVLFLIGMVVTGLVRSPWGVLAVPAAVLIGFCFAGMGMGATSYMRGFQDFDLVPLVTLPLFLFSATFYPLSTYPVALQWIVRLSPLYHGVAMERALTLGHVGWGVLGHAAYLVALGLAGTAVATRRLGALLLR